MSSTIRLTRNILKQPKLPSTHIPVHVKERAIGKFIENKEMRFLWQYRKGSIRRRYASFGSESGLKPGVCWPNREELQYLKEYEKHFEKPFAQLAEERKQKEKAIAKAHKKREAEIRQNLAKLPEEKAKFWQEFKEYKNPKPKEEEE